MNTGVFEGQALSPDPSDLPESCVGSADLRDVSDLSDETGKSS